MATQAELAQQLTAIKDQLSKATTEITTRVTNLETALANAGQTTPEVDAAMAALKASAQVLDDLNPDEPPPSE